MPEFPSRASVHKHTPSPRFRFVRPEQVPRRAPAPLPDMDPDPICPICAKIIIGDLEDINEHIDECVVQPETSSGTASVASSTIPPLERPSSLLVNIDEEDVRFGAPQFSEKDIERVLQKHSPNQMRIKFDRRAAEASKHIQLLREILDSPPMGPELQQLQSLLRSLLEQIAVAPKCPVCWETLKMPAVASVNCWHVCCEECWLRQLGTKRLCPQCSAITNPEDLRKNDWWRQKPTTFSLAWPMLRNFFKQLKRNLFIRTEPTPNPNSLIFRPENKSLLEEKTTFEFTSAIEAARRSPLADELFKIKGIKSVLLGSDFLTVTKEAALSWPQLNPQIYAAIMDFFTTGLPALKPEKHSPTEAAADESEIVQSIREILDARIRPTIQQDGGDVQFRGFDAETGWVKLKLVGACRTCSSSTITLRNGIEGMLMHYIPEVKGVEQVLDEEEAVAQKSFEEFENELKKHK